MRSLSGHSKAYAIDLPGHPRGEISCKSVGDYSDAVHGFIGEGGLQRPVVCGHSMGGATALTLALSHPEDVGGLILVSTGAKLGVDQKIINGLHDQPMHTIEEVITPWSYYTIDLSLGREARAAMSFSNLPVFLNDYLACQGFDVRADLQRIKVPTLVVCGDKDRMTPPKWSEYLNANIPNSTLKLVQDSGHMIPLERPGALGEVVQSFLTGFTQ